MQYLVKENSMWKLKTLFICFAFCSASCWGDTSSNDELYSRKEAVQDHIDECLGIVYKIRNGELEQEEGLEYLEDMLDLLKLITWYCVED